MGSNETFTIEKVFMLFLLNTIIPDNECGKEKMRLRTFMETQTK